MDGPRKHNVKWNKSDKKKTNTIWFYSHVEFKKQNKLTRQKQTNNNNNKTQCLKYREQGEVHEGMGKIKEITSTLIIMSTE